MLTSTQLKKITTEARPIIERMIDDAEKLAGLRSVVAAAGGDWGQLKALIKAQIKDEIDEAGDGKHVRKILDKADYAKGYADMLGLAKMNEENFSDEEFDPETGEIKSPTTNGGDREKSAAEPAEHLIDRRRQDDAQEGHSAHDMEVRTRPVNVAEEPGRSLASVETPTESEISAPIPPPAEGNTPTSAGHGDRGAVVPSAASVVVSNVLHLRTHNPETHFLNSDGLPRLHGCLKADRCAGTWRALCFDCSRLHDGPTAQPGAA